MAKRSWRAIVGLLVVVLAITGALVIPAMADEGEDPPSADCPQVGERCEEFLGRVADNLGISVEELEAAIVATKYQIVDELVAEGKLTEEQAAQIRERIDEVGACPLRLHRPHHGHPLAGLLDRAVEEGVITQEQADEVVAILDQIRDYIQANGICGNGPRGGGFDAMLDNAVENGVITQEQADTVLSIIESIRGQLGGNGQGHGPCGGHGFRNGESSMGMDNSAFPGRGLRGGGFGMRGMGA